MVNMHDSGQDFQAVVSMFCQQRGLVRVIGEYRNAKKSEVEFRNLLQHLKDAGAIIRTDALHTQKTIEAIVESGNHYVAQVKGNQKTLLEEVKSPFTYT